ncbi:glycosyltransferase family 2 protein [Candidatus Parcubacteria bacterium]|nr:glycosyltransferase family 2 protein [Candidatus Parcubacteria bacterium]
MGIYLSAVVPVFNEEGAVKDLHEKIVSALKKINKPFEIIFINDGSSDNTLKVIKSLRPLKIINFRKNFGQTAAMDAGIKLAQGKYIVAMDGDGQNDPADIPKLIKKLEADGLDVVSGWRKNRKDSFFKKFFSRCAASLRKILINDGIHDSGCSLKVYKKECFECVDLYGEMHRFIPAILKIKGFKIGEIEVNHNQRTTGKTKYNWKRGIKGILDMFAVWFWKKYSNRPLHFFGALGIILMLLSFVFGFWAVYKKIFFNIDLSDTSLTILSMGGFFMGVLFFIFGLLADILSKIYFASARDKSYHIKEIIDND